MTALFVPALGPATSFEGFQEIIAHLRAPEGCPWDREQTHQTLRTNLLEETYEVLTAIDADDPAALGEELGDLLLQIVLQAQIANEYGEFRMADVIHGIHTKLVRRHPHVFGDTKVGGVGDVLQNWERLKAVEREKKGKKEAGLLDSTPKALPALTQADQYQARVARVGFEWPELSDVLDKIQEEIEEVRQAETPGARQDELGDLFFAMVNLARRFDIDAESALREANARFRRRFSFLEDSARSQNRELSQLSLEEMLSLWEEAKQQGL
jgi:tetrapyrrole methylase family protein/MazG family protein